MATKKQMGESGRFARQRSQNYDSNQFEDAQMVDQSGSNDDSTIFKNVGIEPADLGNRELLLAEDSQDPSEHHDDFCFLCFDEGNLKLCGTCFRAFHESCAKFYDQSLVDQKVCQYCNTKLQGKCLQCNTQLRTQSVQKSGEKTMNTEQLPPTFMNNQPFISVSTLVCTICYCQTHPMCSNVPLDILKVRSYFFQSYANYVCTQCIEEIEKVRVINTERLIGVQDTLFYFVNAILESPIHCFWIREDQLSKRKKSGTLKMSSSKGDAVFKGSIESIIDFRPPLALKDQQFVTQVKKLTQRVLKNQNNNLEYGSFQNYRFLVRWKNHNLSVWQDQKIISNFRFTLKKFLVKCIFEQCALIQKPKSLSEIHSIVFQQSQVQNYINSLNAKKKIQKSLHITFGQQPIEGVERNGYRSSKIEYLLKVINERKSIEVVQKCATMTTCSAQLFSQTIYELFLGKKRKALIKPHIIIIITEKSQIQKWLTQLQFYCPLLEILTIVKDQDVEAIKKRQFIFKNLFYPQFQVLLLTYEVYLQQQTFIAGKIKGLRNILSLRSHEPPITELIILEMFRPDFMTFSHVKFPDFHKFFVLKEGKNNWLFSQIHSHFQNLEIYKFSLDNINQRECIYSRVEPEKHRDAFIERHFSLENSYCREVKWSLPQRMSFHLFVMAFGANQMRTSEEILTKLKLQYPDVFNQPITESLKKDCCKYVKLFFKLVRDWKGIEIPESTPTKQFLFKIERHKILKRICQLAKMKQVVEQHHQNPNNFPFKIPWRLFISKCITDVKHWGSLQDFVLCSLILKYGFGNWDKILKDRTHWCMLMGPNFKGTNFQSYVLEKIDRRKSEKQLDLSGIIEYRAYNCLELMS